jgi:hypothetical protein
MDRASQVLAQGLPPDMPRTYAALAEQGDIPLSTLHHRAHGRRSKEQKAQSQQYLSPSEEKTLVKFLLQMSDLGSPMRIKFLRSLAFRIVTNMHKQAHQQLFIADSGLGRKSWRKVCRALA